jgi:hypothetical protein
MPERELAAAYDLVRAFNSVSLKPTPETSEAGVIEVLDAILLRTPLRAPREGESARFMTTLMRLLAGLSLLGVGFMGMSMLLPLCTPLR